MHRRLWTSPLSKTGQPHQSGSVDAPDRPLPCTDPSSRRYSRVETVDRVPVREASCGTFYDHQYLGAIHHPHHQTLMAAARKRVHMIYGALIRSQPDAGRRFGS